MEWKIIVFSVVCIAALACLWRGGPCADLWKCAKQRLWRQANKERRVGEDSPKATEMDHESKNTPSKS